MGGRLGRAAGLGVSRGWLLGPAAAAALLVAGSALRPAEISAGSGPRRPAATGRPHLSTAPLLNSPFASRFHPTPPHQERFDVDIKPLPATIDASTYMNAA